MRSFSAAAASDGRWQMATCDVLPLLKRHPENKRVSEVSFMILRGLGFPSPQSAAPISVVHGQSLRHEYIYIIFIQHIVFYNAQSVLDVPGG